MQNSDQDPNLTSILRAGVHIAYFTTFNELRVESYSRIEELFIKNFSGTINHNQYADHAAAVA